MKTFIQWAAALLLILPVHTKSLAQTTEAENLRKTILKNDSIFWGAYNSCDVASMDKFMADQVEFYHDMGGLTLGKENLNHDIKKNLCSNPDFKLRREAVKGTVEVYPLKKAGVIYGAVISGEHVFYILAKGKPEQLDGLAKFTHVWLLRDNVWKMERIISFDHGPAGRKGR